MQVRSLYRIHSIDGDNGIDFIWIVTMCLSRNRTGWWRKWVAIGSRINVRGNKENETTRARGV